jgi:hypothetical protein
MKIKVLAGVVVLGVVIFVGLKAYTRAHDQQTLAKLAAGVPESKATLKDRTIKTQGYTYHLKYYSDAVDVSGFKLANNTAELSRPGKSDSSYIISLSPADVYKDCADGGLTVPYQVTFASGPYSICTTSKSPALVMRFKDTKGTWHKMIFFAASLHSLPINDETFKSIFSSITVD